MSALARHALAEVKGSTQFLGECVIGLAGATSDPRQVRWKDLFLEMVEAGPKALPIVGLLSFLIGVVFAYETTTQLRRFGAEIYVINGSGSGRSAADRADPRRRHPGEAHRSRFRRPPREHETGNMKLNGEIDALKVLGASPVNFLVLPRLAALFWMVPMLALYSDLFGVLGGLFATILRTHIPTTEFWVRLQTTVSLSDVVIGLLKAVVFGILIGLAGTLRGLQCERSSAGVGRAATSAVVTGI